MAKRPDLTHTQRKIVDRYYEHQETIYATKLAELVSELALADSDKAKDKLWKSARAYLLKCKVSQGDADALAAARDVQALAQVAGALAAGKPPPKFGRK